MLAIARGVAMKMSKPWVEDPIEYLVSIKFPLETAYRGHRTFKREKYIESATSYRDELRKLSRAQILERAEAVAISEAEKTAKALAEEDESRFFNSPSARADIDHWSRMSMWTLDQAVALSLDRDPRIVNWESIKRYRPQSYFVAEFEARLMLVASARDAGQLWDSTIPNLFLAWAQRMRFEVPAHLAGAIRALGIQIADWKTLFDDQKEIADRAAEETARLQNLYAGALAQLGAKQERVGVLEATLKGEQYKPVQDRELKTRERESLLKLVIGMALAGYKYDPKAARSPVIIEIADDLAKAGVALDSDTVRKYLQEARELLSPEQ
jgi:hypothetical protein